MLHALIQVLLMLLWLLGLVIVVQAILSWLVAFNVVNSRNDVVRAIWDFLHRVTEPALRPIRRFLPNLGGIDISPIILILLLLFVRNLMQELFVTVAYSRL